MNTTCSCIRVIILILSVTAITSQSAVTQDMSSSGPVSSVVQNDFSIRQADLLRKQGKVFEAQKHYLSLYQNNPALAARGLAHCSYAMSELAERPAFDIFLLPFNTPASEYGITFLNGSPSFSRIGSPAKHQTTGTSTSVCSALTYSEERSALITWNAFGNEAEMLQNANISIFGSRAIVIKASSCGIQRLFDPELHTDLFLGEVSQPGYIDHISPWPFTGMFHKVHSACFSEDGSLMVFSARNDENNFDLYISDFQGDRWSIPVSIGAPINTEGNEITPFFSKGVLYFSSDTHAGLGGFDVFYSGLQDGMWLPPLNMGNGVNSTEDDFYLSTDGTGTFYFTSNRLGGKGMHDLYGATRIARNSEIAFENQHPNPMDIASGHASGKLNMMAKPVSYSEANRAVLQQSVVDAEKPKESTVAVKTNNRRRFITAANSQISGGSPVHDNTTSVKIVRDQPGRLAEATTYFIQLLVSNKPDPEFSIFRTAMTSGDLYAIRGSESMKIMLGSFLSETEARNILEKMRTSGFPDAFLVSFPNKKELQPELLQRGNRTQKNDSPAHGEAYKIRLGAFQNPEAFPIRRVRDLGALETWTKGKWTIFVLSGYRNKEEAMAALEKAKSLGLMDCQLVMDRNGMLEVVK